ncbi:MAG: hypothetical protein JO145_09735 [Acidobacteriaceae bacterium]|nr:hypothetical protein [Acidobacteriaceae bacterium]
MSQHCCLVLAFVFFGAVSGWAVDPNRYISQYAHMSWRVQDGFFNTGPFAIAQTQDGYVWIGTNSGLLKFDGVRFLPWRAEHGEQLPSTQVNSLLAARDGSLWIATYGGLSRWKDHTLTNYPSRPGGIVSILEDSKGRIWFGENFAGGGTGPLCEVLEATIRCYGAADGLPSLGGAADMLEDRNGDFWIAGIEKVARWNHSSHSIYQLGAQASRANGIHKLALSRDGTLWVGIARPGPGFGLERIIEGRWSSFKKEAFDSSRLSVQALYADRQGALWIGTFDRGIYRIYRNQVDHFDSTSGLSGDWVAGFTEDREGNLWVVTTGGADRFADTPIIGLSSKEGLCSNEAASIAASRDGSIWVGGAEGLSHLRGGTVSCIRTENGLPGRQVTSLLEDHVGRLWVGLDQGLWVYDNGVFRGIHRPDGSPTSMVMGIAEDLNHNVWIAVAGPPRVLMRVQGLMAREESPAPPKPRKIAADPMGGIWLGLLGGDLAHYHEGKQETYRFTHDSAALVNQLVANSDGLVLAATSYGLIGWRKGRPVTLARRNGLPSDAVYALTFDTDGNLWLFMDCGLVEISSTDAQRWLTHPNATVPMRTFDAFDGVRAGRPSFDGAVRSPDGRLWFVNGQLLEMIDPAHLRRNSVPPPVHVEQVIADRKSYAAIGPVRLPARTRDLEIDYAGLSFTAPQKVRFRYRLEGRDEAWEEPGTRRQAFYTDLGHGAYRFRVIACNNDGLWNDQGAALDFVIAAPFYQTVWFRTSCALALLALLWELHRYRLRQLARVFNLRLEERVNERTRIARELHDTLLQGFQGLMFRLQAVGDLLPQGKAKDQLERALERGDQAIAEGRTAVYDLRSSSITTNDLAEAVKSLGEELATTDSVSFRLVVEGVARDLHPIVRDEIYRIAREALRNAFSHADAHRVETEIAYTDRALRLRIRDDGKGIPPEFLEEGRRGHYGLCGMRERARQIGGKLDIWSRPGAGAEIELSVANATAYRTPVGRLFFGIFRKKRDIV